MSTCQYVDMSVCRYVRMSIFQNENFQLRHQKKSCSECQINVRKPYVGMSTCRYVSMSICQNATFQLRYQNESCSKCHKDVRPICQLVRIQLFSLGIKIKVVQNVIRMSDSQYAYIPICQFVSMSICQRVVRQSVCHNTTQEQFLNSGFSSHRVEQEMIL